MRGSILVMTLGLAAGSQVGDPCFGKGNICELDRECCGKMTCNPGQFGPSYCGSPQAKPTAPLKAVHSAPNFWTVIAASPKKGPGGPSQACTAAMNAAYESTSFSNILGKLMQDTSQVGSAIAARCEAGRAPCTTSFGAATCCIANGTKDWAAQPWASDVAALQAAGQNASDGSVWLVTENITVSVKADPAVDQHLLIGLYPTWFASACDNAADHAFLVGQINMQCTGAGPPVLTCRISVDRLPPASASAPRGTDATSSRLAHAERRGSCVPSGQQCLICTNCPYCCSGTCAMSGVCL
jgi:hypothetical protein